MQRQVLVVGDSGPLEKGIKLCRKWCPLPLLGMKEEKKGGFLREMFLLGSPDGVQKSVIYNVAAQLTTDTLCTFLHYPRAKNVRIKE